MGSHDPRTAVRVLGGVWMSQLKFRISFQKSLKLCHCDLFTGYGERTRNTHAMLAFIRCPILLVLGRTHHIFDETANYQHRLTFLRNIPAAFTCRLSSQFSVNRNKRICLLPVELARCL